MVYVKNSLHYDFTDFKQIYIQDRPFSFPIGGLGSVSKSKIKKIMNKSILEFYDYSFKQKEFEVGVLDQYKELIRTSFDQN